LNYPVLYLFNTLHQIWGVPLLFAYIFGAWAALIGLMAYIVEGHRERR
jgi:hypothetical protein